MQTLTYPVKATGDENQAQAVITTREQDREGDVIEAGGIDLAAFKQNPVVLWAHDYSQLPVGKCTAINQTKNEISAVWKWLQGDPFADRVKAAWNQGILNAVSVGFKPKESSALPDGKGVRFTSCELLEFSVVPVPANAHALRRTFGSLAKAAGLFKPFPIASDPTRHFAPAETVLEVDDSPVALELADEPQHFSLHDPAVRNAVVGGIAAGFTEVISDEVNRSISYLRGRVDYPTR